jgi:translation initiation factor IF-3
MFFVFRKGVLVIAKEMLINERIRFAEVRLVGSDGVPIGVVSSREAQNLADEAKLDLVCIAPQAKPPVCKIIDYGKFKFEQAKKIKDNKKSQKVLVVKEIRLSANIGPGDFQTKVNHAKKFLSEGDKLKISMRFRGREITHNDLGKVTMERFAKELEEEADVEKAPKLEGRQMFMFLAPKK